MNGYYILGLRNYQRTIACPSVIIKMLSFQRKLEMIKRDPLLLEYWLKHNVMTRAANVKLFHQTIAISLTDKYNGVFWYSFILVLYWSITMVVFTVFCQTRFTESFLLANIAQTIRQVMRPITSKWKIQLIQRASYPTSQSKPVLGWIK